MTEVYQPVLPENLKWQMFSIEICYGFILSLVYLISFLHKQAHRAVYAFSVAAIHSAAILCFGKIHLFQYSFLNQVFISSEKVKFIQKVMIPIGQVIGAIMASIIFKYLLDIDFPKLEAENVVISDKKEND